MKAVRHFVTPVNLLSYRYDEHMMSKGITNEPEALQPSVSQFLDIRIPRITRSTKLSPMEQGRFW